jgi:hypothetical protein
VELTQEYRDYRLTIRNSLQEFCYNCYFWYASSEDNNGECRFGSPILVSESREAIWPITQPSDGCGDYECLSDIIETCSCEHCQEDGEDEEDWNEQVVADILKEVGDD